jgi:hypothetical protein
MAGRLRASAIFRVIFSCALVSEQIITLLEILGVISRAGD